MSRWAVRLFPTISLLCSLAVMAHAQTPGVSLFTGKVLDQNGAAVPGAVITAQSQGQPQSSTTSD